ncbi:MAG: hydrogenase maturation protease [Verrucomicrobiales bacterium]|nr:hydrogenase maturation protease [Verrucomicrobiales bacterium]
MNAGAIDHGMGGVGEHAPRGFLVVGYGNRLRGDDGVGPAVAEAVAALRLPGVQVDVRHQLTPEVAVEVAAVDTVVFVDARRIEPQENKMTPESDSARHPLWVRCLPRRGLGRHTRASWTGHRSSPEPLVTLAEELRGWSPESWEVGIPVAEFGWGDHLSPEARREVPVAVETIVNLWRAWYARQSHEGAPHLSFVFPVPAAAPAQEAAPRA